MATVRVRLGTFNISGLPNLNPTDTRTSTNTVAASCDVGAMQEMSQTSDNKTILLSCPSADWSYIGGETENDQVARRSVATLLADNEMPGRIGNAVKILNFHGGLEHVTPNRTGVRGGYKLTPAPAGKFGVLSSHWVSGVYAGNDHLKERKRFQDETVAALREEASWNYENGLPTFYLADTNWHPSYSGPFPQFHERQVMLAEHGIDKIWYVPGKDTDFDVKVIGKPEIIPEGRRNPSNHAFVVVTVDITIPDPPPPPPVMGPVETKVHEWAASYTGPVMPRDELAELFSIVKGV